MSERPPDLTRAAYAYLARYASSAAHLHRLLDRRLARWARLSGGDAAEHRERVTEAIAACQRAGLLNDTVFAAHRTAALRQRGWSARRIAAALAGKGLERADIATALEQTDVDDEAAARRYAERRRLGPWRLTDRAERRARDIAAMARAGFGGSLARRVIDGDA
ncbi:MAG: RecX family transcriptional regulator [Alphaproteobacteria bacterium]|nr:RecX family transcriptional regulator [Alphaproteobacteria bacterium]